MLLLLCCVPVFNCAAAPSSVPAAVPGIHFLSGGMSGVRVMLMGVFCKGGTVGGMGCSADCLLCEQQQHALCVCDV